ncbi:unnamed protein product [Phaeothamnion confervicola]
MASFLDDARRRDQRRGAMEERGLSPEQIAVYLGDDLSADGQAAGASAAEREAAAALERFQQVAARETAEVDARRKLLGKVPSHKLVEVEKESGEPLLLDRFVFVDEYTCIGCTHCSHVAPNTFFMQEDHGRARVFQQGGEATATLQEAIETCPVDCIHFVPWEVRGRQRSGS